MSSRFRYLRQLEPRILLGGFAFVSALWGFFALADEIGEGDTGTVDRWLITIVRTPCRPTGINCPLWFKEMVRDVTALGGPAFLTLLTIVLVLCLSFNRKRREAAILALTAIGAETSIELLKFFYDRPRPGQQFLHASNYATSFPSGHSAASTAIFLTAATIVATSGTNGSTKSLVYAVALLTIVGVGVSRIYLGFHWPTDVFGGWVLGFAWAIAAWVALRLAKDRTI